MGPASSAERDRICGALVALVAERGYEATTEELIAERAGVGLETFSRYFAGRRDCIEQVWEEMTAEVISLVTSAFASREHWRDALRAAAYAALRYMEEDPLRARFFLIEVLAGGEMVQARRDLMMNAFVDLLDAGRRELEDPASVPRSKAEAVTGAIYESMISTMQEQGAGGLDQLVPKMMYLAVLSYLGEEAAEEELRRGPDDLARYRRGQL